MTISKKDVEHIAHLARLELTDEEKDIYSHQLSQILDHVGKISELELEEVEPTSHSLEITNAFRKDELEDGLTQKEALSNAPDSEDGYFVIPPII